jgi:hypothetical protein
LFLEGVATPLGKIEGLQPGLVCCYAIEPINLEPLRIFLGGAQQELNPALPFDWLPTSLRSGHPAVAQQWKPEKQAWLF